MEVGSSSFLCVVEFAFLNYASREPLLAPGNFYYENKTISSVTLMYKSLTR